MKQKLGIAQAIMEGQDILILDEPFNALDYKTYEDVKNIPEIQYAILENASKYLKDDGLLVYSTCTLEKKENIDVVEKFLENNSDFYLDKVAKELYPNIDNTDGFFIARLKKK